MPLTLAHHQSLLVIMSGGSLRWHPVSAKKLMNVHFCQLTNSGVCLCKSPLNIVVYESVLTCSRSLARLWWFLRWEAGGSTVAVLWRVASGICSRQHAAFLSTSHPAFSLCVLLVLTWCIHMGFWTQLQRGRNPVLFYQRSDFHLIINLSIAVRVFPMHMLTWLLVDEILLLRYMNWSTNFRGLTFNKEMAPICLKLMNSVLSEFT